jgi:hypothetical protein
MNSSQYKYFLILLKAYVTAIDLPILQGFDVKQENIYGNNYYSYFASIPYPLWNVYGGKEPSDSFVVLFLIL